MYFNFIRTYTEQIVLISDNVDVFFFVLSRTVHSMFLIHWQTYKTGSSNDSIKLLIP